MAKIGVTGAAGYIGSRVMKRLLEEGYGVDAIDDFSNNQVDSVQGVDIRHGDVENLEDVETLSDSDVLLHLAAVSGADDCEEDPEEAYASNVVGTENVAWLCREEGIPLVFPCSMAIIGDPVEFPVTRNHPRNPLNLYGFTKRVGESNVELFAEDEFPAHVYMKSNVYGHHAVDGRTVGKSTVINFFIDRASSGEPLTVYEPGTQARDFVHVRDVAEAYVESVERLLGTDETGVETFEVASGRSTSILEVAEMVADGFERVEGGRPGVEVVENPRPGEAMVDRFEVYTAHTREALGWEASTSLEDAVIETIEADL